MSSEAEEEILHLRRKYRFGPIPIVWYPERCHAIKSSDAGVDRTFKRHSPNRLLRGTRLRQARTQRHNKQVPVLHIQMNVKFLIFRGKQGQKVRRYRTDQGNSDRLCGYIFAVTRSVRKRRMYLLYMAEWRRTAIMKRQGRCLWRISRSDVSLLLARRANDSSSGRTNSAHRVRSLAEMVE